MGNELKDDQIKDMVQQKPNVIPVIKNAEKLKKTILIIILSISLFCAVCSSIYFYFDDFNDKDCISTTKDLTPKKEKTVPVAKSSTSTEISKDDYIPILEKSDIQSVSNAATATQLSIIDWGIKGVFTDDVPLYSFQTDSRGFDVMNFTILADDKDFFVAWIYRFAEDEPFYDFSASNQSAASTISTKEYVTNNKDFHWFTNSFAIKDYEGVLVKKIGDFYYFLYNFSDSYTATTVDTPADEQARFDKLNEAAHSTATQARQLFISLEAI